MIMQKIINVLALTSFAVSAGVVAGGSYLYVQREAITENIKSQIMKGVSEAISSELGDLGSLGGGELNSEVPGVSGDTPGASIPSVPF